MDFFFKLLWMIPLFPAIGAAINGLFGKRYQKNNRNLVHLVAIFFTGMAMILAFGNIAAIYSVDWAGLEAQNPEAYQIDDGNLSYFPTHKSVELTVADWMLGGDVATLGDQGFIGAFKAPWTFAMDHLTAIMLFLVTFVGFLIHIFSVGYMDHEPAYYRFFAYLNLFMASMLILILGGNVLLMFVGWEGVGLCSYLLIGFFFKEDFAADAGKKAFLTNRVGDMGFVVAGMLLVAYFGTLNFRELGELAMTHSMMGIPTWVITAATLCMFVGATGKSAQLPLYIWLPDAMAGPTPVSALIHAATMVTSGVYMIARANGLFMNAPFTCMVVATVGVLTALFAASIALVQNDIKKVLAYSTVSQLGYMFLGVGVGAFGAGIFHVLTHGFFKALMFLGSGSIIHALHHEQDMRRMGDLRKFMPITFLTFAAGWWAIIGLPPFSGFFSKDEILWRTKTVRDFAQNIPDSKLADLWIATWPENYPMYLWGIGAVAAGMTAFYMTRLMGMTFFGKNNVEPHTMKNLGESGRAMTVPLMILAVGAALLGLIGMPAVVQDFGGIFKSVGGFWEHWFAPVLAYDFHLSHDQHIAMATKEWISISISIAIAAVGTGVGIWWYFKPNTIPNKLGTTFSGIYTQLMNKHWVDEIYYAIFIKPVMVMSDWFSSFDKHGVDGAVNRTRDVTLGASELCFRLGDRLVIEWALVNGLFSSGLKKANDFYRSMHSGQLQHSALGFGLGLVFLAIFVWAWL